MSYRNIFRRRRHRAILVLALALPALVAGWVSGAGAATGTTARSTGTRLTPPTQNMAPQKSIGKGEGQLNLIAWEGYTQAQWVKPFEQQTGCQVNAKYAGSSSEMVSLMANGGGGQYDLVSASGDADLRLIYGGDVKPVNISLIPAWKQFRPFLAEPGLQHDQRRSLRRLAPIRTERPPLLDEGLSQGTDVVVRHLLEEVRGQDHDPEQPDPDSRCRPLPVGAASPASGSRTPTS